MGGTLGIPSVPAEECQMEATDQAQQLLDTTTTMVSTWGLQVLSLIHI